MGGGSAARVERLLVGRTVRGPDLLLALAWVATAGWWLHASNLGNSRHLPGLDAEFWMRAARAIAEGDAATYAALGRSPGAPVLVAAAMHLGVPVEEGYALLARLAWLLLPGLASLAATRFAGRAAGVLAAGVTLLCPLPALSVNLSNSQPLYNLVCAAFLVPAALALGSRRPALLVGVGVAAGLLVAVKDQGVPVVAGWVPLTALSAATRTADGGTAIGRALRAGGWSALGLAVGLLPTAWLAWTEAQACRCAPKILVPLDDFVGVTFGVRPTALLWGRSTPEQTGVDLWTGPASYRRVRALTGDQGAWALGSLLLGLLGDAAHRRAATVLLLVLSPLAAALLLPLFYPYHLGFVAVPAAVGLVLGPAALGWRAGRWWGSGARVLVTVAGLVVVAAAVWPTSLRHRQELRDELALVHGGGTAASVDEATRWVRARLPAGARVWSLPGDVASRVSNRVVPTREIEEASRGRRHRCDTWLVYSLKRDPLFEGIRFQPDGFAPVGGSVVWRHQTRDEPAVVIVHLPGSAPESAACRAAPTG